MVERMQRRLAAIVAADVVGYSRMMGLDEAGTLQALLAHRSELISPLADSHGGRIVKTTGDGALLEFPSVIAAVEFAVAAQTGMRERNDGVVYLKYKKADALLRIRDGKRNIDIIGVREKFDDYRLEP